MIAAVADTHAVIWYLYDDSRLSKHAGEFLEAAYKRGDQIGISSITMIEMVYLIEKGRIQSEAFIVAVRAIDELDGLFIEIPVSIGIARAMSKVSSVEVPDMPDRIVAATAVELNVPVISRDGKIQLSSVMTIW
ncbi:MAG: PIN domain-containing protein [Anaerolineaceae bacterium]|nr:PIN domain-containing protein [Anaerolineaceae bacterium]